MVGSITQQGPMQTLNKVLQNGKDDQFVKPGKGNEGLSTGDGSFKIGYSTRAGRVKFDKLSEDEKTNRVLTTQHKLSKALMGAAAATTNLGIQDLIAKIGR